MGEAFYWQLLVASKSQALVPVGEFNYTDISWRSESEAQTIHPGGSLKALVTTS